jgi:N-methylhydantoinase A
MLMADAVRDYSEGVLGKGGIEAVFTRLERRARRESRGAAIERSADLRYRGQSYEIQTPWANGEAPALFHREHARVYGYSNPEREVEVVTLRVRARTALPKPKLARPARESREGDKAQSRRVWTGGGWKQVAVWHRAQLGNALRRGPALILDYGSATLAPQHWTYRVDNVGNLVMRAV